MPGDASRAGLCADCVNAQTIVSTKGSAFIRCMLHENDGRYPKYPRLPVVECPGYARRETKERKEDR